MTLLFILVVIAFGLWIYKQHKKMKPKKVIQNYSPLAYELNSIEWQFHLLLKEYRANLGLNDLMPETMCGMLANKRIHELKMLTRDQFKEEKHKGFFANYEPILINHGFKQSGEISARYYNSITAMFRNYIESPLHKQYIESKNIKYVGYGVIDYKNKFYSCIIFTN